ncbi:MAG: EAL domain-containing protein [Pseudomonadota bacterium]
MLRFLERFSVEARFLLALGLPLVAIAWMTTVGALERHREASNLHELETLTRLAVQAGSLVHHLQVERGVSQGYLGSQGSAFNDAVQAARAATDHQFNRLRKRLDQDDYSFLESQEISQQALLRQFSLPGEIFEEKNLVDEDASSFRSDLESIVQELQGLSSVRQRIDDLSIPDQESLDYYTQINLKAAMLVSRLSHKARHAGIARNIAAHYALMVYKDLAGIERARISHVLSGGTLTESHRRDLLELWGEQRAFHTAFLRLADTPHAEELQAAKQYQAHPERAGFRQTLRENIIAYDSSSLVGELPTVEEWFGWQTDYIDQLKVVKDAQAGAIMSWAIDQREAASFAMWRYLVISPLTLLVTMLLLYFIVRSTQLRLKLSDTIFRHAHDGITVTDHKANIIDANRAFTEITGYTREEIKGKNPRILQSGRQDSDFYRKMWDQLTKNGVWQGDIWNRRKSGDIYAELLTISAVYDKSGEVKNYIAIFSDITQRARSEQELRLLERSLASTKDAVAIMEVKKSKASLKYVNPAFLKLTGYQRRQVMDYFPMFLFGESTDVRQVEKIRSAMRQGTPHTTTLTAYHRDGSAFWCQLSLSPVTDSRRHITHYVVILNDITRQQEQQRQLAHQATHDALTGLGNRSLLEDRLSHDVALAKRHNTHLAVLFIDLDEFKPINDTLGHRVGDQVLVSVAVRLRKDRRASDTVARFGGDEFVLLLPDLVNGHDAEHIAEKLLETLNLPHRIGDKELHVSASIGIAYLTEELKDPEWLIRQADMAMYQAKQQGRNTYSVYEADEDQHLSQRVQLRSQLQEAIEKEQLILHYQPILDTHNRVVALEALVRWQHPTQGFISPGDFIPLAEETGQIIPLSRWVKERACRDTKTLIDAGLFQGRVAVNLSPVQFHRPQFLEGLRDTLANTGLPAKHLELELTEGILMRDSEGAIDQLHALAAMGVTTAIDDFGTGYSSLSYLKNLPVHKVKIDRSFVSQIVDSRSDMAICQGVLTLAGELGLAVVAEGIEAERQRDILVRMGCPLYQGYWFARPMPMAALESWLEYQMCQAES